MTGLVCFLVGRDLVRLPVAALLVTAAQVVLHAASPSPMTSMGHPPASLGGAEVGSTLAIAAMTTPDMVLSHAVAAAVTVLVLVWQAQAFCLLVRHLAPRILTPGALPAPPQVTAAQVPVHVTSLRAVEGAPRRGPPSALAAA